MFSVQNFIVCNILSLSVKLDYFIKFSYNFTHITPLIGLISIHLNSLYKSGCVYTRLKSFILRFEVFFKIIIINFNERKHLYFFDLVIVSNFHEFSITPGLLNTNHLTLQLLS